MRICTHPLRENFKPTILEFGVIGVVLQAQAKLDFCGYSSVKESHTDWASIDTDARLCTFPVI